MSDKEMENTIVFTPSDSCEMARFWIDKDGCHFEGENPSEAASEFIDWVKTHGSNLLTTQQAKIDALEAGEAERLHKLEVKTRANNNLVAELKLARAQLSERDWVSMETAPPRGEEIIVLRAPTECMCVVLPMSGGNYECTESGELISWTPTHWQPHTPFPAPPIEEEK